MRTRLGHQAALVAACFFFYLLGLSLHAPPQARAQPPLDTFDEVLRKASTGAIEADPGPSSSSDSQAIADYKQQLAQKIALNLPNVKGADGVHTVAAFKLTFAVLVWEWKFAPAFQNDFSYGNSEHQNLHGSSYPVPYKGVEFGALPLSEGDATSTDIPGFGKPCKFGGSVFAHASLRNGVRMNCMVFYSPLPAQMTPQRWDRVHARLKVFGDATKKCYKEELKRLRELPNHLPRSFDLDRLAACAHAESSSTIGNGTPLRGVAVVPAFRAVGVHRPSGPGMYCTGALHHEDYGMFAPHGSNLMNAFDITVQHRNHERVICAAVYFFSSIGYLD